MPSEVITVGPHYAITLGLAALVGVAGRGDDHSHWTHQIAIDMAGREMHCLCDGEWLQGTGIFMPAGHKHLVQPSRQLNLFFDTSVDWLTELFGGHLDISHGRVLDRDTLQGIQSCFYQSEDLAHSMSVFASAFELRTRVRMDPLSLSKWEPILETAKQLKANDALTLEQKSGQLAELFAR